MQKQLVTIDNLDDFICKSSNKFYMDGTRILTPGAKDELSKRGVTIEFGSGCNHQGVSCSAASQSSCGQNSTGTTQAEPHIDEMLIAVAATLQKEYGINDPAQLKSMSREIVKTLNENLSIF